VFLGGVPWDVTELALRQAFLQFGTIQVEWPGKENSANPPKGYVYILFENEKQVKALLAACTQDINSENYYFKISSRRMRQKEVQVIPWVIGDSNYVQCPSHQLDPAKTVFVGALHGMLSAEALATIMNDLFGGVVYSGIDTDKHKYPIGSGRVTFNNAQSYKKAVRAAFIEIKTSKFTKKVQIDPYLADSPCQLCGSQQGPYFCRDENCFRYYCRLCWQLTHSGCGVDDHKPLMRDPKLRTQPVLNRIL
ncbi:Cytoplasmic polyadenylation element-binding protein 1-B, partial [Armadillidium vulgare]